MSVLDTNQIKMHLDISLFSAAIEHTAAQTGFSPELIEKDYYCTLILNYLAPETHSLIFKGGTLLAKVHAGFYRLSEDLDFTLPISPSATRKQRSNLAKPIKSTLLNIPNFLPEFSLSKKPSGSNESRQYNSELTYKSCLGNKTNRILVEIGLREELKSPLLKGKINTLLINPFSELPLVPSFQFPCLSKQEAYAEKIRAALCREKLAIRDFYDLHYATKNNIIDIHNPEFIHLVKSKLTLPNTKMVQFNGDRLASLKKKIDSELLPTLNQTHNLQFSLEAVIEMLAHFSNTHL